MGIKFGITYCNFGVTTRGDVAQFFEEQFQQIILADQNDFSTMLVCEQHGVDDHSPSPLIAAAAMATATRKIRVGTGALLLPLCQPVRVAEDGACIDVMSHGRFVLGVGYGYRPEEFSAFMTPLGKMDTN